MAADLTIGPWDRLAKLSPPGVKLDDLQAAADRHALRADLYAALADLWEEAAMCINLAPDENPTTTGDRVVNKVSQDGITVEYASDPLTNTQTSRSAQHAQYMAMARRMRAKSKPSTPLVHEDTYNPWLNTPLPQDDCETIIVVDEV